MFARTSVLSLILALVFPFVQSLPASAEGEDLRLVRVGLFESPPLAFMDDTDHPAGLYVDLLDEIAAQEGWQVEYVPGTWAEGLARLRGAQIDLMPGVMITADRDRHLDFCSQNILMVWGQVFVPPDSPVQSILDLADQPVAIMKGDLNGQNFLKKIGQFGIECEIVVVGSHHEVFRLVQAAEAAAGVTPNTFGTQHTAQFGLVPTPIIFDPRPSTFAVSEALHPELLAAIDQRLKSWKRNPDSFYFVTLNQWFGSVPTQNDFLPRWFINILVAAVLVAILLLAWNRILNDRVKARTRQFEASETQRRLLFDQTFQFLGLLDTSGNLVEVNRTAVDFLGIEPEAVIGLPFWECPWWNHDPELQTEIRLGISQALKGEIHQGEATHIDAQGGRFTLQYVIKPVFDQEGLVSGVMAEGQDITEQLKLENDLRQSQRMEAVGTLAGGIAHDFNNILTAIIGFTELAMDDSEDQPEIQRSLREVAVASDRARDLVQQILTVGRREESEKAIFPPSRLVTEAVKLLRSSLPTTINISTDIQTDLNIQANPTQIHQVIMNLGTNAFHAMEETGGEMGVVLREVTFEDQEPVLGDSRPQGHYVLLEVSDTGVGMGGWVQEKIFEPYFTSKGPGKGSGLGLSVVHGIVKSSGGFIRVQSEQGHGSVFQVYLPVCEVEPSDGMMNEDPLEAVGGAGRILFVDDEAVLANLANRYLSSLGYQVIAYAESTRAWRHFEASPDEVDLLITDQTMPKMTGTDLIRKVREIRPDLPVILCTGYNAGVEEETRQGLKIDSFLHKPMPMRELAKEVSSLLGSRKNTS